MRKRILIVGAVTAVGLGALVATATTAFAQGPDANADTNADTTYHEGSASADLTGNAQVRITGGQAGTGEEERLD